MAIFRLSGALLSIFTLVLIVYWTINLYERDIEDLPLILALQDEIRIKPEQKGGAEISFKGLSVNEVLEERERTTEGNEITLAPSEQVLFNNELSPIISPEKNNKNNIAESITNALESLLGVRSEADNHEERNIELHIASYGTAEKANAHWFMLQQLNSDLLVNYNHRVVKVTDLNEELYRLRVVGFETIAMAQDMCARLIERGEKCVPAVGAE